MYSLSSQINRAAIVNPTGCAVQFDGKKVTWPALKDNIQRFAGALKEIGLCEGDRVAMLSHNSDTYFSFYFAVPWAGGIAVPINVRLAAEELAYWLNDSGSRIILVDDEYKPLIETIRHKLSDDIIILSIDGPEPSTKSLASLMQTVEPLPDQNRCNDDIAMIFYTGGTTGYSKGVMMTHHGLVTNILQWSIVTRATEDDLILIVAPMFHLVAGLNCIAAAVLAAGIYILPKFEVSAVLQAIQNHQITNAAFVPTMIDWLLNNPDFNSYDLGSLIKISYGASPMEKSLLERAIQSFPQAGFCQVYGQTESGGISTALLAKYHNPELLNSDVRRSAGKAAPGIDLLIIGPDGIPLPTGESGEICMRGPSVTPGYWGKPALTAETIRDGWLHTGDVAYMDEEGFVYIVDRLKDMIISGGENIYSQEVETILQRHSAIAECAVIGVPSQKWGEEVHAVVHLSAGADVTEQQIIDFCKEHLAAYKCVRTVDISTQPLPRSAANKILKHRLKEAYCAK